MQFGQEIAQRDAKKHAGRQGQYGAGELAVHALLHQVSGHKEQDNAERHNHGEKPVNQMRLAAAGTAGEH
jgi:hypothetical protein